MSFLEHLDELRRRLVRCFVVVILATAGCWFVSEPIYNFLAAPVERALSEAQRRDVPIAGLTGNETISALYSLKENETGRFVFAEETKLGTSSDSTGASVTARALKDSQGQARTISPTKRSMPVASLFRKACGCQSNSTPRPKSFRRKRQTDCHHGAGTVLALHQGRALRRDRDIDAVSASCKSGASSPGLYPHERAYVTPFIVLSSISFVLGAAFAYYVCSRPRRSTCSDSDRVSTAT